MQLTPGARGRGEDVLREVIPGSFERGKVKTFKIDTAEITVLGEYVFAYDRYASDRVVDSVPNHVDSKFPTVLRRRADGSWKIFRDCSNSNLVWRGDGVNANPAPH